ncbi:MAG: hypothetical protein ABIQ87_14325 [Rubrivivax sp.]
MPLLPSPLGASTGSTSPEKCTTPSLTLTSLRSECRQCCASCPCLARATSARTKSDRLTVREIVFEFTPECLSDHRLA